MTSTSPPNPLFGATRADLERAVREGWLTPPRSSTASPSKPRIGVFNSAGRGGKCRGCGSKLSGVGCKLCGADNHTPAATLSCVRCGGSLADGLCASGCSGTSPTMATRSNADAVAYDHFRAAPSAAATALLNHHDLGPRIRAESKRRCRK